MAEFKKELQAIALLATTTRDSSEKATSSSTVTDLSRISRRPSRYVPRYTPLDFWSIGQSEKPTKHRYGHD